MQNTINLYSVENNDISIFLEKYFNTTNIPKTKIWSMEYKNPVEMVDLIGVFLENTDKYHINMWISIDEGIYINITNQNGEKIIRYLFERYPY